MTELEKYIKAKKPVVSDIKARVELEKKARATADKFFPNDEEKNKLCADAYELGMFDTLELIYC